jgi:alpha-acetolactate decarboxylase
MHEVLGGGAEAARPHVTLAEVLSEPNAHGVGALSGLEGEITILNGQAWIARPEGTGLRVDGPRADSADGAAFLTVTHVDAWTEFPIEQSLQQKALEDFIVQCAVRNGVDPHLPFPFQIEGQVTDLQVHVINRECPMRPGARLTTDQRAWRYQLESPVPATIVGFYAADSVGELTHPGTSIHAHAIFEVNGEPVTAHVERIAVDGGAMLRLAAR